MTAAAATTAAAMLLAACAQAPLPAHASTTQESILMDDAELVYVSPERLERNLATIRSLGVDRIRVSVYWRLIAPDPDSRQRPQFGPGGPSSPSGYPREHWERYDRIVTAAARHGVGVLFSLTGPVPLWASGYPERRDIEDTYEPSAADFRDFVTAVAQRYSGGYTDQQPQEAPQRLFASPEPAAAGPAAAPLPRVDHWSIWNEPNHAGWLTPQWVPHATAPSGQVPAAPRIYRALVDGAYAALQATGHGSDVILLAETAPRGLADPGTTRSLRPLTFVRELYCLTPEMTPYTGALAEARGCPPAHDPAAFASAHPGLFAAAGWAHHPYALESPPGRSDPVRDNVVLADLGRLTRTLDRIFARHGQLRRLPLWLTEYGYQTDPPDPTVGVRWAVQADYLNEADFIAYANPRVASTAQFLLVDDAPLRRFPASDPRHWGTFQTGLVTLEGRRKASFAAYERPIHVTPRRQRPGRSFRIFGQLRGGTRSSGEQSVRVEFRRAGEGSFRSVGGVRTSNPRGYAQVFVRARGSGAYRLVWNGPNGQPLPTRAVPVRVGRRLR